jgi:hypothetical protein
MTTIVSCISAMIFITLRTKLSFKASGISPFKILFTSSQAHFFFEIMIEGISESVLKYLKIIFVARSTNVNFKFITPQYVSNGTIIV